MNTSNLDTRQAALDAICRAALDGVIVMDCDSKIIAFNEKAEAILGRKSADVLSLPLTDTVFAARDAASYLAKIKSQAAEQPVSLSHSNTEWTVVHKDGTQFPVEVRVSQLDSLAESPILLFLRDLTDRRKREDEIGDAREIANRATATKSYVISMLAHDMRTSLGGITGSLALLNQDVMAKREREIIAAARSSASQLRRLLDDTLDYARLDAGEIDVNLAPVEVSQVTEELSETWAPRLQGSNCTLRLSRADGTPERINTDIARLRQILGNLLSNAVKYAKGFDVTVEFFPLEQNGLGIIVSDDGPGFSGEALSTAFEPFLRPAGQSAKGAGLGLSIVQTLTERLGGTVSLGRSEHDGALIELRFPNCRAADAEPENKPSEDIRRFDGLAVLLVEDNATNQLIASRFLEQLGCDVTVCGDGITGLETARDIGFDAIFMDIDLPGMKGTDVMRAIRRGIGPNQNTPLIAFTAFAIRSEREEMLTAGANTILAKPVSSREDFADVLQSALEQDGTVRTAPKQECKVVVLDPKRLNSLRKTLGEDDFSELTSEFVSDLENLRKDLSAAGRDGEAVRKTTHIVIGVAGAIGAQKAQHAAEQLNSCAHTDAMDGIEDRVALLDTAIGETMSALDLLLEAS